MNTETNEIVIGVNTLYKQYKKEFIKAYNSNGVVNDLLDKCKLPIKETKIFFLDFDDMLAVCMSKNGKKFYVDTLKYF